MIKNILRKILVLILCFQLVGCATIREQGDELLFEEEARYTELKGGAVEVGVANTPATGEVSEAEAKEAEQTASEEVSETEGEATALSAREILAAILLLPILAPFLVVGGVIN